MGPIPWKPCAVGIRYKCPFDSTVDFSRLCAPSMLLIGAGRFPRTLIDLQSAVVSLGLAVSSKILDLLLQIFRAIRKRIRARSFTYLDVIEGIVGARGFLYFSEAVIAGEFAFLLGMMCISRRGVSHQELDLLRNNRLFMETMKSKMPHVLRWYQAINAFNIGRRLMEFRDAFKSSPSIFDRTPAEATRRHSEESARGLWGHPPAAGKVSLHFFQTYRGQPYDISQDNLFQDPDVRIDLNFDSNRGVDLGKARNLLGVEKLSVITALSPYRPTFDPIDRDKLSPLAVYDLSRQLREPIRVFEPYPSRITKIKRVIHESVSLSTYLAFTLLRSCLGFTLRDRSYLAVTFGDTFAATCVQLSRLIHPLNEWTLEGAFLITRLCACVVLLPLLIFFKVAVFVLSSLSIATRGALALLISLLVTFRAIFSFLLCLSWQARIAIVVLSWITVAEFLINSRSP